MLRNFIHTLIVKTNLPTYLIRDITRTVDSKFRSFFHKNPVMPYLESHLTDHCNLNCAGCSHFSPLSSQNYVSIEQYKKDIQRLAKLFANIRRI